MFSLTKALTQTNLGTNQENAKRPRHTFFVLLPLQSAITDMDTISMLNIGRQQDIGVVCSSVCSFHDLVHDTLTVLIHNGDNRGQQRYQKICR